ncbi:hypothetical protein M5K25_009044 [Dendrobium thyrsiflorum]|uniref:Uncharacterized protein n=1 Tax=Dendrobium thyrsiflorum TaxID=117978 RepID=A0ABD0V4T0_DENTH
MMFNMISLATAQWEVYKPSEMASAPQRRQPAVPLPVASMEAFQALVSPPSSSRKRGVQAELFSPPIHRISIFVQLSCLEIVGLTPTPPPVASVPPIQSLGHNVASSSTSSLGRRTQRNRNMRLCLTVYEEAVRQMSYSVARQEPVQQRMVPLQREPRRPPIPRVLEIVIAFEIDAVQGERLSPLVHSGNKEDVARIAAAPPVTTTLPRTRVPRDSATQMVEMARAMAAMISQLIALGATPHVMDVGTPTTSRDEPIVPLVVVTKPMKVNMVQRTVSAAPTVVPFNISMQSQLVQLLPGQIQDMITQRVEWAISSRKIKARGYDQFGAITTTITAATCTAMITDTVTGTYTTTNSLRRERETLRLKDQRIHELEEEIRDFTVFIEAQKALDIKGAVDDIRGGTLLPVFKTTGRKEMKRREGRGI